MSTYHYLLVFLVAFAFENPVLSRALGVNKWFQKQNQLLSLLIYGGTFCWISLLSTMINYAINSMFSENKYYIALRALIFLVSLLVVYLLTLLLVSKVFPQKFRLILKMLPLSTFNTAIFATFYVIMNRNYNFLESLVYSLGTGIGYSLAIIVLYYARKRLMMSPVGRNLKGTPILLIYIGLLSLGLYGLLGYGIA